MSVTKAEIESIRHDISKTSEALDNLYMALGQHAFLDGIKVRFESSENPFEMLQQLTEKKKEIEEKLNALNKAIELLNNGGSEIIRSETNLKHISSDIDTLTASLGAVAYEVYHSGSLPSSLLDCLESMKEFDLKVEKLVNQVESSTNKVSKMFAEKQLHTLKNHIAKPFYETGVSLLESKNLSDLNSSRAGIVISQIQLLKSKCNDTKAMISRKTEDISHAQNSLKTMGALGEENRTIKELEQKQKKIDEQLDDCYLKYGRTLANSMVDWVDSSTDEKLLNVCSRIKTENSRFLKQQLNLEYLLSEKEIDIYSGQTEQLNAQLEHLISEKELVEKQMSEIKEKICNNEKAIELLRTKEKEIGMKVLNIKTGDLL